MKNIILFIILSLYTSVFFAQVTEGSLVNIHSVSNDTEMNLLVPNAGSLIYNTAAKSLYIYTGTYWKNINSKETTYETVPLTKGNQIINVRDADKIVGFTLISNSNWLYEPSGRMVGTWMIGKNRERIRCYIQTLEHPYVKFLVVSVKIEESTNQIVFTNYSSRYWTITDATPQSNLSNNQDSYRLGKIVIIRKE
ncbi:MAG: hypothetical protein JKY08_07245 [Flavobacteriaceae bacterium]|nr:hypothetical protein [Flavobacteriaceae bacterium]